MRECESNFNNNIEIIKLSKDVSVTLEALMSNEKASYDISISVFEIKRTFSKLSWLESKIIEGKKVRFTPKLRYVMRKDYKPFLAIIGLFDVIFIKSEDVSILQVVKLNRNKTDDQGFYYIKILLLEDSFIIVYEGGAFKINDKGIVLWNKNLKWDDIYLTSDKKYLYYSSEFKGVDSTDWAISIENGNVFQMKPQIIS